MPHSVLLIWQNHVLSDYLLTRFLLLRLHCFLRFILPLRRFRLRVRFLCRLLLLRLLLGLRRIFKRRAETLPHYNSGFMSCSWMQCEINRRLAFVHRDCVWVAPQVWESGFPQISSRADLDPCIWLYLASLLLPALRLRSCSNTLLWTLVQNTSALKSELETVPLDNVSTSQ